MLPEALKAGIPVIGVFTDDPVNIGHVLQLIAEKKPLEFPGKLLKVIKEQLFYTFDQDVVTADLYRQLNAQDCQLVVINPEKKNLMIFEGGEVVPPESMILDYVKQFVAPDQIDDVMSVLRGLSLKAASEMLMLTMARTGGCLKKDLRATRMLIIGTQPGLEQIGTEMPFYQWNESMLKWAHTNKPYFLNPAAPSFLRPRGLLLDGMPGVGKSSGAKAIAALWGVPLFRLDIASTLNRFIGESEGRLSRSLAQVEREGPCVLLIDEVEKVLHKDNEHGTTTRMLSQLLWWLQEHQAQVLTVMTTNSKQDIPPELYREGRVDKTITMLSVPPQEIPAFCMGVLASVMPSATQVEKYLIMKNATAWFKGGQTHSTLVGFVYDQIKMYKWMEPAIDK